MCDKYEVNMGDKYDYANDHMYNTKKRKSKVPYMLAMPGMIRRNVMLYIWWYRKGIVTLDSQMNRHTGYVPVLIKLASFGQILQKINKFQYNLLQFRTISD